MVAAASKAIDRAGFAVYASAKAALGMLTRAMALELADRAYILEVGNITLQGPAAELAHDPNVVKAYLGG